jgi:hypothetical protein
MEGYCQKEQNLLPERQHLAGHLPGFFHLMELAPARVNILGLMASEVIQDASLTDYQSLAPFRYSSVQSGR